MLAHAIRRPDTKALDWSALQPPIAKFWADVTRDIDARHRGGRLKQWLHYLAREYPQADYCFQEIRRINAPDELWQAFERISQTVSTALPAQTSQIASQITTAGNTP